MADPQPRDNIHFHTAEGEIAFLGAASGVGTDAAPWIPVHGQGVGGLCAGQTGCPGNIGLSVDDNASGVSLAPRALVHGLEVKAHSGNTDTIWVGADDTVGPNRAGYGLIAGETIFLRVNNANEIFIAGEVKQGELTEKIMWVGN